MGLTLNQAAKLSKRAKSTLLNALRTGLMSGSKDERGNWSIEPAELFRVYQLEPPREPENRFRTGSEPFGTGNENHNRTPVEPPEPVQNHLAELVKLLQDERIRERQQLESTIADLRLRLDASERERRQLLLTHQKPVEAPAPVTQSKLYQKLFGRLKV